MYIMCVIVSQFWSHNYLLLCDIIMIIKCHSKLCGSSITLCKKLKLADSYNSWITMSYNESNDWYNTSNKIAKIKLSKSVSHQVFSNDYSILSIHIYQ